MKNFVHGHQPEAGPRPLPPNSAATLTEEEIDAQRLLAFKTNDATDMQNYFLAVSKWFQDRHYRRMERERNAKG